MSLYFLRNVAVVCNLCLRHENSFLGNLYIQKTHTDVTYFIDLSAFACMQKIHTKVTYAIDLSVFACMQKFILRLLMSTCRKFILNPPNPRDMKIHCVITIP